MPELAVAKSFIGSLKDASISPYYTAVVSTGGVNSDQLTGNNVETNGCYLDIRQVGICTRDLS
jgi:hypothetical protein